VKDFAAIDFETANNDPASICSIGVVIVRNGMISDRIYELVRPEPEWYAYWNTRVHGLTEKDTVDAPTFDRVWQKIEPQIEGLPLVAHNSAFDERCLKAVFKTYGMTYPDYVFHCTCRIARKVFEKKILPDYRLHTVAAHCGYDLRNHHHALADAEACAVIAQQILQEI
jgi:DNA polymerase-3 subunit epsilon